jgi:high-affinity iron transporter
VIEAFVITLREGTEAALVVCLAMAYLRKIGRPELGRTVVAGVLVAGVLSIAAAVGIKLTQFSTDGAVEGMLFLVSSALVSWLVYWMWRHGRMMKQETEARLGALTGGGSRSGLFLFAFLMVFREGMEMVVMLVPVDFTTDSVLASAGAVGGLAVAIALGTALTKGAIRVDLRKFFSVTSIILLLFALQLFVSGLHEFAEAGWIPSSEAYMRVVGPLMKHSTLFVIAVLVLPFFFLLRRTAAPAPTGNQAEDRKARAASRSERIAKGAFATLAIGAVLAVGVSYAHESKQLVLSDPEEIFEATPEIVVPLAWVSDDKLHRFGLRADGKLLRFLVVRKDEKKAEYAVTMDACSICSDWGYVQLGERILCRNCVAEINRSSIGESGGCNPIPLTPQPARRADALVIKLDSLLAHASFFRTGQRVVVKCAGCGMELDAVRAGRANGKWYCDMPARPGEVSCRQKIEGKP